MSPAKVVSPEEYRQARLELLVKEKEATRARDALARQVQQLPIVEIQKDYTFTKIDKDGKETSVSLADLFDGRRQLIIYHFMFDPAEDAGCSHCSVYGDSIPRHLEHLWSRDTTFTVVSRAPIAKIDAFRKRMDWTFPWVSSYNSDFNYDFHTTQDEKVAPIEYNFKTAEELKARNLPFQMRGEQPGTSTFIMGDGDEVGKEGKVYHTYSTYGRGSEISINTYTWWDMTHLGRQDAKYESTSAGINYHDMYEPAELMGKVVTAKT